MLLYSLLTFSVVDSTSSLGSTSVVSSTTVSSVTGVSVSTTSATSSLDILSSKNFLSAPPILPFLVPWFINLINSVIPSGLVRSIPGNFIFLPKAFHPSGVRVVWPLVKA